MDKEKYPFAGSKFSVNLAELMEKAGDNTITLGAAIGRSSSAITHWITGRYEPRNEMIDRIAVRYGVDPLWLAGIKEYAQEDDEPEMVIQGVPHDMIEQAETDDMAPTSGGNSGQYMPRTGKWWPYVTLGAASSDMTGWCARMIREYGRQTMAMMMAEAVRACPSPVIDNQIRTWAARQPRCGWHTPIIPYWAMNHLVHELMKMERPDVRREAKSSSQSEAPTREPLRLPLYGTGGDL
jgi:transcriptional regulator with XRE-family HTH domain